MKFYVIFLTLLFGLGIQLLSALPQMWQNELAIRQGLNVEWSQTAATDSDGSMIILWSDTRNAERDMWAQKVDIEGNFLWNNGQSILIANGLNLNINPIIIPTSDNQHVIAWISTYYPSYDPIHAQKINQDGELQWQENGVLVCEGYDFGVPLQGCSDNAGGIFLVWDDSRDSSTDIYASHILADGSQPWAVNGIPLANTDDNEAVNSIIADGTGGFIIAFTNRINHQNDLFMNRILADGTSAWNGVQILSEGANDQEQAQIASDGTGSFVIAWKDPLVLENTKICAQKINLNGQFLWADPVSVYPETGVYNQSNPQIISSSDTGVIIAWEENTDGEFYSDVYAQKLSVTGDLLWSTSSVQVAAVPYYQHNPRMVDDADGGCFMVWDDTRNGNYTNPDVYAQHILANGTVAWEENGHAICNVSGEQSGSLIRKVNDNLYISWIDYRTGSGSIYYQVLTTTGNQLLENNGKLVFSGMDGEASMSQCHMLKRANDVVIVWQDTRATYQFGYQIYFQIVEPDGTVLMPFNGKPVTTVTGNDQENPSAIVTPDNEIAIVWSERISIPNTNYSNNKIYAQLLSASGEYLWGNTGIQVSQYNSFEQNNPKISYENGYFYIGWSDADTISPIENAFLVRGQKIDHLGNLLWGTDGKLISEPPTNGVATECLMQKLVGRYFVWLSHDNLYAKLMSPEGNAMQGWNPEGNISSKYASTSSDYLLQLSPVAAASGDDLILAWEDLRVDWIKNLYAQKYNSDGSLAWDSLGVVVGDYGREQDEASLYVSDGVYIPWRENIDGSTQDIAIQKLSLDGEPLWGQQGTFVIQRAESQSEPAIAPLDNDNLLVAWSDSYGYENDIYMRRITTDGQAQDDALGYLVCNAPNCQLEPQIVSMGNDKAFIMWNDARIAGSSGYAGSLFMQFVDYSTVANNDLVVATPVAALYDNYPNPFNPETTISFNLAKAGKAKLEIFNIKGQVVTTLVDDIMDAGTHKIMWNGKNQENKSVGSGVYFYRLTAGNLNKTKKMILLK